MITARRTRLVRAPDLHAFRRAIVDLCGADPQVRPHVVVPTRGAAHQLIRHMAAGRRLPPARGEGENQDAAAATAEGGTGPGLASREERLGRGRAGPEPAGGDRIGPARGGPEDVGAEIVTREELYEHLRLRLPDPPRPLTPIERDVIAQAAARATASSLAEASFQLRPGLVGEMLRFYDHLRRHSQQVTRFEELIDEALGGAAPEVDRGAERMLRQTRFLSATFREYERRVRESGACDEHTLRERLVGGAASDPVRRIIVTVGDWIADDNGFYAADFDLLARIPHLESLDVVCTEGVLRSGFQERLHNWLPGIEETDAAGPERGRPARDGGASGRAGPAAAGVRPVLVTPPGGAPDLPWWTHRDREEELIAVARMITADRRRGDGVGLSRTAVVYKRPLPYLYLAAEVFTAAHIPYQTSDALPLAGEPTAAAFDLVLEAAGSDFTRGALVALLQSPHFVFTHEGVEVAPASTSALDRALSDARYLGGLDRLESFASGKVPGSARRGAVPPLGTPGVAASRVKGRHARGIASPSRDVALRHVPALQAAVAAARALARLATPRPASDQLRGVLSFWTAHARPLCDDDPFAPRERRARAAIVDTLAALADAHAAEDNPAWTIEDLGIAVRRAIEEQTFVPESPDSGQDELQLLDDQAARYSDFDDAFLVGVVENEWPEKPRRNIFYPPALLKSLGWPTEKDRRAAADARFLDLIASSSRRTIVSTFTLDDDALVMRSVQLDDLPRAPLSSVASPPIDTAPIFVDEALALDQPALEPIRDAAREWAELRMSRTSPDAPQFHGTVGGTGLRTVPAPARETGFTAGWAVSALEIYLGCPFKFFAQHVLKLEEDPDDEEVMDPRRQGRFVHEVFEQFFGAWQDAGSGAITPDNLDEARSIFVALVERSLGALPASEAGLERTRLLGSPAAAGLGEAVFRMEAERKVAVVERLLEHTLEGDFTIATSGGPRTIALKGKADRLDLLEDGTFRLIDYKLGWPPDRSRALQLPIYSVCAGQRLASHRGRQWMLREAAYLAFKGPRRVVPLFAPGRREQVLESAQQRLADTVDAIARGEFPPSPDDVYRCETCSFAPVCRKDYVGAV